MPDALKPPPAELSHQAREVEEKRARSRAERMSDPILPRGETGPAPLSFGQQQFWLKDRIEPGCAAYNCCVATRIEGDLNPEILREAIARVVARHEILRTVYPATPDGPRQMAEAASAAQMHVLDLRRKPDIDALAQQAVYDHVALPFDLERGPVFRTMLIRTGEREYLFPLIIHHIGFDGVSRGPFFAEVFGAYERILSGAPEPEKPPIQYADFACWQRRRLAEDRLAEDLAYWRRKLEGCAPFLEPPFDRPPTAGRSPWGLRQPIRVEEELVRAAEGLAERFGATVFDVYLACYLILLHRLSGQPDILLGAPTTGRVRPELAPGIGYFVNTLILRSDASDDPAFGDFLVRTKDALAEAHAHKDLPIERLVEDLNPPRSAGRPSLVQFMFQMRRRPWPAFERAGLRITEYRADPGVAPFEMSITLLFEDDGTYFRWEASRDLFEPETVRRWMGHIRAILAHGSQNPETRLSRIPLHSQEERRQLIRAAAAEPRDARPEARVHELFERQARAIPEAIAVVSAEGQLSYRELDRRANRMARRLIAAGVSPGSVVAAALGPCLDLPAAWLGILKAGAAYLPLDPKEPEDRARRMLADASVKAIVVSAGESPEFADFKRIEIGGADQSESADDRAPEIPGSPRDLAYVIYTSGSTGPPKGVAVEHRSVCGLARDTNYIRLGPDDVVAQAAAVSFDATTFEVWGALLAGAKLVIAPRDVLLSPGEFAAWLARERVTALFITTALLNRIASSAPGAFAAVRTVLTGGEAADPSALARIMRAGAPGRLVHVYGPTETTTFATWDEIAAPPEPGLPVPIGRAVAGARVHVLDSSGEPAAIGEAGEICIGGRGVARGYLNDAALTAEKFVADPFAEEFGGAPGAKMYRTGDLGRLRADGRIEFIGRKDRQFKIRGFRVELGEVEAALSACSGVAQCAVLAEKAPAGEMMLAAFVVRREDAAPAPGELRAELRAKLPEYLIPSSITFVGRLPLTPAGKLDRAALLAQRQPESAASEPGAAAQPTDELEYYLLQIWREALGGRAIGMDDDFFDSGGHSLAALGLLEQVQRTFGRRFPASALFGAPTPRAFAGLIRSAAAERSSLDLVEIRAGGEGIPWICAQGGPPGGLYVFGALARLFKSERPVLGLEFDALDGRTVLYGTVEATAEHYIARLKAARPEGPYLLGGYCHGGLIAYEMARRLTARGDQVPLVVIFDAIAPGAAAAGLRRAAAAWARMRGLGPAEELQLFLRMRVWQRLPRVVLRYLPKLASFGGWRNAAGKAANFFRHAAERGSVAEAGRAAEAPRAAHDSAAGETPALPAPASAAPAQRSTSQPTPTCEPEPAPPIAAQAPPPEAAAAPPDQPLAGVLFRSQGDAVAAYVPGRYRGRVLLVQPKLLIAGGSQTPRNAAAWERCVGSGLGVIRAEGDHYTMFYPPHVEALAAAAEAALAEAEREAARGKTPRA